MTEIEKYQLLLQELAELIKTKNDDLWLKDAQIEFLQKKLELAEAHSKGEVEPFPIAKGEEA